MLETQLASHREKVVCGVDKTSLLLLEFRGWKDTLPLKSFVSSDGQR